MLVCNVSLRPPRKNLTVEIAEAAIAADSSFPGTLFDTLVDDPASADTMLDAYLGAIMLEAASASDTVDWAPPAAPGSTWNPSDKSANMTLSNGNLTAQCSVTGDTGVRGTSSATTGKLYFEVTTDQTGIANGGDTGIGIGASTANLNTVGANALNA